MKNLQLANIAITLNTPTGEKDESHNMIDCPRPITWPWPPISLPTILWLPILFNGLKLAKGETSEEYKYSKEQLSAHIQEEVLPGLAKAKNKEEVDVVMAEVYKAYPAAREMVEQAIKDNDGSGCPGNGEVQGLFITGTVVAAWALGVATGLIIGMVLGD